MNFFPDFSQEHEQSDGHILVKQLNIDKSPLLITLAWLVKNICWHGKIFLECSLYLLYIALLTKYIVVKFQVPNPNTSWDMNYFPPFIFPIFGQVQTTGRKQCIWAHSATCTGGLKNYVEMKITAISLDRIIFGSSSLREVTLTQAQSIERATRTKILVWGWISKRIRISCQVISGN